MRTKSRQTFVSETSSGHLWEVTRWVPGEPLLSPYSASRTPATQTLSENLLRAAMRGLAEFHLAASSFPQEVPRNEAARSAGLQNRLVFAKRLMDSEFDELEYHLSENQEHPLAVRLRDILRLAKPLVHRLPVQLRQLASEEFELQPCMRDVRCDHVLFEGSELSSFIDFGAMQQETVASDIARMLGSVDHIGDAWATGLAAYQLVRPLTMNEQLAVAGFHSSSVALSGLNWMRWILIDKKSFESVENVERRLDEISASLQANLGDLIP